VPTQEPGPRERPLSGVSLGQGVQAKQNMIRSNLLHEIGGQMGLYASTNPFPKWKLNRDLM